MKNWNSEQKMLLKHLGLSNEQDESVIENKVSEQLQKAGFDLSYGITDEGRVCESILDAIG